MEKNVLSFVTQETNDEGFLLFNLIILHIWNFIFRIKSCY